MSKTCELCFNTGFVLNCLCELLGIAGKSFGNDNDERSLAAGSGSLDIFYRLVLVKRDLGNGNGCRACGNSSAEGNMSCPASHNFNNVAARMRFACVTETVNHVYNGVHRRVKAYRVVGRCDIVVYCAGNTYCGYAAL